MTCYDCDKEFDDYEEVIHINGSVYCQLCADIKKEEL
jgi:hypothetical protein